MREPKSFDDARLRRHCDARPSRPTTPGANDEGWGEGEIANHETTLIIRNTVILMKIRICANAQPTNNLTTQPTTEWARKRAPGTCHCEEARRGNHDQPTSNPHPSQLIKG
jgi:hypothetical protein